MGCFYEAQLVWKRLFVSTFSAGNFDHGIGQTNLVNGVPPGFITKSVYAGLQVSVRSGYDLCHSG